MQYIEIKDPANRHTVKLTYDDVGSGTPVVLIHGWPSSKEMWENQVDHLVKLGMSRDNIRSPRLRKIF